MVAVVVIVLAALGVPVWLVLGAVGAGLWSRRAFRKIPGVIPVRWRIADADETWPRRPSYAHWVHDVLIVHQGTALVRTRPYPVAALSPSDAGPTGVAARLRLDGGECIDVAAAAEDRERLHGPFGAAASVTGTAATRRSPGTGW